MINVKKTADRVSAMKRAVQALAKSHVLVGIPADSSDNSRDDGPINNSELGFIHEFGAPEANIPARPFLVPGVKASWAEANGLLSRGAENVLQLNPSPEATVTRTLEAVGLLAQGEVVRSIDDGLTPVLNALTLAARKRKGFAGTKPLIVTGQLKQSITYVVKNAPNR